MCVCISVCVYIGTIWLYAEIFWSNNLTWYGKRGPLHRSDFTEDYNILSVCTTHSFTFAPIVPLKHLLLTPLTSQSPDPVAIRTLDRQAEAMFSFLEYFLPQLLRSSVLAQI